MDVWYNDSEGEKAEDYIVRICDGRPSCEE